MNKLYRYFIVLSAFSAPLSALDLDQLLPVTNVVNKGELTLKNNEIIYSNWSSRNISSGRPAILYHVSARRSSDITIRPIMEKVRKNFAEASYTSVTIVNTSDALWGTKKLVPIGMTENKKENPAWHIISDDSAIVRKYWQLDDQGVSIIILNQQGTVVYILSKNPTVDDEENILKLLRNLMAY